MNKRVIDKSFYNIYPENWKQTSKQLREQIGKCEFCGHHGKDSNMLTCAHLDQNPQNNDRSNLKVLCRSCHIRHDQKYHLFSMVTNKKTDNSYTNEKVLLRLETVELIPKDEVNILEAYAGSGVIWSKVKELTKMKINVTPIEIKDNKKGFYLQGSNEKFLPLFDFEHFDIIDLDAYGVPYNQLEVVFERKFKGYVHCTYIQSGTGRLPNALLEKIGYNKEMIKKIPTLFCRNGMEKMERYLSKYGVNEINGYFIDRKNYFYFKK